MILLLDRTPGTYGNFRAQEPQLLHPCGKSLKRLWNPTDAVVQRRRPVQRDNHIIDGFSDSFGLRIKEQSGSEKRDADPFIAKHTGQYGETAFLLGFAAGK